MPESIAKSLRAMLAITSLGVCGCQDRSTVGEEAGGDAGADAAPLDLALTDSDVPKMRAGGIVCLIPEDSVGSPNTTLASEACWSNPDVAGVFVRTTWSKVEGTESVFDWSFLDLGLTLARQHGKFIGIGVIAGFATPSWVYAAGAPTITLHQPQGSETESQPWDATYATKWRGFVAALGARFDGASEVAYVAMAGPGREFETYYVSEPQDVTTFDAIAPNATCGSGTSTVTGSACLWLSGAEAITDAYAMSFPATPFLSVLAPPEPTPAGQAVLAMHVDYAVARYPGRFGVRSDGLRPSYGIQFGGQTIEALSPTSTVGFQMSLPTTDAATLAAEFAFAVNDGAHFVEVYRGDVDDPTNSSTLATYGPLLAAN